MTLITGGQPSAPIGVDRFGEELSQHLARLRQSLQQMLNELGSPRTPTLLQRQLGVGYTICWQVFQVVRGDDQGAGTQHAPSIGGLKRLISPALDNGMTPATAAAIGEAADAFHRFIHEHAEDRDYFDSIVAGTGRSNNAKSLVIQHRRAAYRANSRVWGSQSDLWLTTSIVRRSEVDPTKMDSLILSRQQGLRRIRADATVYLMSMKVDLASLNAPSGQDDLLRNALDPVAAAATGMPLLPEFSTNPLPRVKCRTTKTGRRLFYWVDDSVGLKSSCDVTIGTMNRGVPMIVEADGRREVLISSTVRNKSPALLVLDLLVHRASFPGATVQSMIYEALAEVCTLEEAQLGQQFAVEESVVHLGPADAVNLIEFPAYRGLLRRVTTDVGWNLSDFDAYRLRVPFPIMGTVHRLFLFDPLT